MEYLVTWKIDIDGDSPVEAAQHALRAVRDEDTEATVFEVTDKETGVTVIVDADEWRYPEDGEL